MKIRKKEGRTRKDERKGKEGKIKTKGRQWNEFKLRKKHINISIINLKVKQLWQCSVTKLCLTLCDPMDCSMPGSSVLHYLLKFVQIHVHWWASQVALLVKNLPANAWDLRDPWVGKIPWRWVCQPTAVFLPRSPWTLEPGKLQSIESWIVGQDWNNLAHTCPLIFKLLKEK